MNRSTLLLSIAACALAASSAACAPARIASTETTAARVAGAEVEQPAAREAAAEVAESDVESPPGQLVCRTKSKVDGTAELYLGSWGEEGAQGFLRTLAPSGMVYTQRVHAERYKDAIVVDQPGNTDLVCHSAIVAPQNGKQYMRLGDAQQLWSACE